MSVYSVMRHRLLIAVVVGCATGLVAAFSHRAEPSDLTHLVEAARLWLQGGDPYTITYGPYPLFYPFPAVLVMVPLTVLPSPEFWFVWIGVGLFVWSVQRGSSESINRPVAGGQPEIFGGTTRYRVTAARPSISPYAWLVLLSPAGFNLVFVAQWSALITSAALVPALGFLLACKPTLGAALFAAFPSRLAFYGGLIFVAVSLALFPEWPWKFLANTSQAHHSAPILFWGGPLVLLALTRWRHWDARLLVALACVPQSHFYHDGWPLWLIPQTLERSVLFTGLSWVVALAQQSIAPDGHLSAQAFAAERIAVGQFSTILLYLPCLWMVLFPANQSWAIFSNFSVPNWITSGQTLKSVFGTSRRN